MQNNYDYYYEIVVLAALAIIIFSIQALTKSVNYLEDKIECINQETTGVNK